MHKIIEIFADRAALHTEILALRQQVAVLKRKRPRPSLRKADRVFWVILSCLWPGWRHALAIVRPETVIGWHRKGFRLFWTWKSRRRKPGRPPVSRQIRHLVRRMSRENTRWGAPRLHGELLKLGFSISQAAVSKYMVRYPSPPSQSWRTFLTNHADCLASIDFFVVPTATFHLLFGFIVLHHERRQIMLRCHGEPDDGVGRTADPRGIPVGHGAAVPDPRPGRRIRAIVPLDRDGDGRGRGRHGATEPVAKSVCGTPDRQREARMPGPFDHPQRAAFAAHSWLIPRLLSRFKDPLVARQGHTGWTTRSAGRVRNGRFLAQGRRSASSLRTPRGLTTRARIRSISLCGDVDATGTRMPLHRFAGTIRRNKHRDDRAHGRLQNPLAQNDVRAGEPSRRWEARWNKWKGQPLLSYYILWLLRQKRHSVRKDDDDIEKQQWLVLELCQLFEGCGVTEECVLAALNRLYDRRLIEALDPNIKQVAGADKIAIKESGLAHLELTLNSEVYVEQMAVVTGLNELFARDHIRKCVRNNRLREIRDTFLRYILKIDSGRLEIPPTRAYVQVKMARAQIESLVRR